MAKVRNRVRFLRPHRSPNPMNSLVLEDQRLERGYIVRGSQYGYAAPLDAATSGYILVGDGTDVNSVAVSGDITISSTGVTTLGAGAVDIAMLAATTNQQCVQIYIPAALHNIPAPLDGTSYDRDSLMGWIVPFNCTLDTVQVAFDTAITAADANNYYSLNLVISGGADLLASATSLVAGVAQYAATTLTPDQNNNLSAGDIILLNTIMTDPGGGAGLPDLNAATIYLTFNYSLR